MPQRHGTMRRPLDGDTETTMPKGTKAEGGGVLGRGPKKKRKYTRRAWSKPGSLGRSRGKEPRFGVFDDGSVAITVPSCQGKLTGQEARDLVEFIGRLKAGGK